VALELIDRTAAGATRERVYLTVREAITTAGLAPGRRLSENELAGELGVSRTPIREALALLREERLVAIVPQLGTFVTRISTRAVADAAFVREALECSAVKLAAERIDADALEGLQANLAAQEQARDAGDVAAFDGLDDALHRALCEASGHGIAWTLAHRANGQLDRVRRLSLREPGYLAEMVAEHGDVLTALGAGDAEAAERTLRHHLRMVPSLLPAIRVAHPEYFEEEGEPDA
jgi:GntR family transcriptional regulator, rspAB operon transcriptional repressor